MLRARREDQRIRELERAVAEAREAARRAEAQRSRLAGVVAAAADAALVVDADGVEVFRNARAARFRKARGGDAVVAKAMDELAHLARRGEPSEREIHLHGPPAETFWLWAVALHDGEDPAGAAVFARDVSTTRRTVDVRRDFVANVSHELRTPIGALQVLAETLAELDEPEMVRKLVGRVARETTRLGHLVDDLLELTTLEAQVAPVRTAVVLEQLLAEAVDRVITSAEAAGVAIVTGPLPSEPAMLNHAQVLSAVVNVLENAVHYSTDGGRVFLDAEIADGELAIRVTDEGIGIPARDLERIFERFYRVDSARSRTSGGTGLGLAIVRHAVALHGGEVEVRSTEGEGTTFTLRLPADDPRNGTSDALVEA